MPYMVHAVKGVGNYAVIHEIGCPSSRGVATVQPSNANHQWFAFDSVDDAWNYANEWKRERLDLNRTVRPCGTPHCQRFIPRQN